MNRLSRLIAAVAVIGLPAVAQAQAAQTASITTTADVATVFSFLTPSAMNFPAVVPGAAAVTATGSIGFQRNTTVKYTIGTISPLTHSDLTTTLTGAAGTFSITRCGIGATNGTTITSVWASCAANSANTYSTAPTSTMTEYIIFEGSLSTTTSAKPGLYTGSISITATVN